MLKNLFLFAASILLSALLAEFCLRFVGIAPLSLDKTQQQSSSSDLADFTLVTGIKPDAEIGWVNEAGYFKYNFFDEEVFSSHLVGGDRKTTNREIVKSGNTIVILGDSYSSGMGINDEDTFAWKLQEKLPETRVLNYAVGAHSTCQTMLLLERLLTNKDLSKSTFILGLNDFLELRNYPDPRIDLRTSRRSPHLSSLYPRCNLSPAGKLQVLPPVIWGAKNSWSRISSLALATELVWRTLKAPTSESSQREVAFKIIERIKAKLDASGARLVVFMQRFEVRNREPYQEFFQGRNIQFIPPENLVFEGKMTLPDGHPNAELNSIWANRLEKWLQEH